MVVLGIEGGSWDGVAESITIPRYEALRKAWQALPPTASLLAAWIGYKPPPAEIDQSKNMLEMLGKLKAAGGVIRG